MTRRTQNNQPPQDLKAALESLDEFFDTGAEEIELVDSARVAVADELGHAQHGQNALDVLADLLEWSTTMGGFEAKRWRRARKAMNDYHRYRDKGQRSAKR